MEERLQKYLASCGVASRRMSEEIIKSGRVAVNGQIVTEMGVKIKIGTDKVTVDGKDITPEEEHVYLMLDKPEGYVTTAHDPQGRPTVLDLVAEVPQRVFPIGRLDVDTEGLLFLTNDGELAYRLTHPKFAVTKVYHALVTGKPSEDKLDRMRNGLKLEDGMTKPCTVKVIRRYNHKTMLEITISEGRNRQVRRMCQAIGNPIIELERVKIENIELSQVKRGQYRKLTLEELAPLMYKVQLGANLAPLMLEKQQYTKQTEE